MQSKPELLPLTGLRAFAAFWVVCHHLRMYFVDLFHALPAVVQTLINSGDRGVDLFFILSGFVIAYNYQDRFAQFRLRQYGSFLWMRLARLYPVHLITLLGTLLLYLAARDYGAHINTGPRAWTAAAFIANLFMVHHWLPGAALSWNYPAWSISCEWLAYLAFPLIVRRARKVSGTTALALLVGAPLFVLCILFEIGAGADLARIACEFSAGCFLYLLFRTGVWARGSRWLVYSGLALGLVILCASPFLNPTWLVFSFALVIYGTAWSADVFSSVLASRPALFWGKASYSLYMTHALVYIVVRQLLPLKPDGGTPQSLLILGAWLAAMSAVGAVCYLLIEEPGRKIMRRAQGRWSSRLPSLSAGSAGRRAMQPAASDLGEATVPATER